MESPLEFKGCELELKAAGDDDPGELVGYAATWSGPDRAGEQIVRGAFLKSLPDFLASGFLASDHDWKSELGTIEEAHEDENGLLVRARFFDTPDAQIVRRKLAAKIARQRRVGMSIGYKVLLDRLEKGVRYLKEISLFECSVVAVPCNITAHVSAIKSIDPEFEARRLEMRRLTMQYLARSRAS